MNVRSARLSLALLLGCLLVPAARSQEAVVGLGSNESDREFYAAFLCRNDGGGGNWADVYKGLKVQVLQRGADGTFAKVRVPWPDSRVVRKDTSWPDAAGGPVGWVNTRFLQGGQSSGGSTTGSGVTLLGQSTDTVGLSGGQGTGSSAGTSGGAPGAPANWTAPSGGPGQEAWRRQYPKVAYIIYSTGDDESWFEALARGNPSTLVDFTRADAAAAMADAGLSGTYKLVRVKVSSTSDYLRVLREGLVPAAERSGTPVYTIGELVSQPGSILCVTVISHAGCDGPFFPMVNHAGRQSTYEEFRADRQQTGANSLYARLVRGARFRVAGCNTGTDYMWYEWDLPGARANPSYCHGLAAILADKKVVAYGKYNSGDVNAKSYAYFACPQGLSYPVRHVKPKRDYCFGTTRAAVKYVDIQVRTASAQERAAYAQWYQSRGFKTENTGQNTFAVKAPQPVWYTRTTPKPQPLVWLVRAIDAGTTIPAFSDRPPDSARQELLQAWYLVPWLATLIRDGKLLRAIQESKQANSGVLDVDDFRIWAVMFRPSHDESAFRADLCNDPYVAWTRVQN